MPCLATAATAAGAGEGVASLDQMFLPLPRLHYPSTQPQWPMATVSKCREGFLPTVKIQVGLGVSDSLLGRTGCCKRRTAAELRPVRCAECLQQEVQLRNKLE